MRHRSRGAGAPLSDNQALNQIVEEECQAGDDEACDALTAGGEAKLRWFAKLQKGRNQPRWAGQYYEAYYKVAAEECQAGDDEACEALRVGGGAKNTWLSRLGLGNAGS